MNARRTLLAVLLAAISVTVAFPAEAAPQLPPTNIPDDVPPADLDTFVQSSGGGDCSRIYCFTILGRLYCWVVWMEPEAYCADCIANRCQGNGICFVDEDLGCWCKCTDLEALEALDLDAL